MNKNTKAERIRQIQQLNKLLRKQIVQRYGMLAVALLVVGSMATFGLRSTGDSHAATVGSLSMSTLDQTVKLGDTVTITIREDTGTDAINAMQASITYDTAMMQYLSMTEGGTFTNATATSTGTPGVIRIARSVAPGTSVTGANTVVVLKFKVTGRPGAPAFSFDKNYSFLVSSTTNTNILSTVSGLYVRVLNAPPTITSVSPSSGPTTGGTTITISGSNFTSGVGVYIGGVSATDITSVNATTITARVPAHAAGAVDLVVVNVDYQGGTKTAGFTYVDQVPTITSVSPASGVPAGGTSVTITGTNFMSGTTVSFGGTAATSVSIISPTQLIAITPAHVAGPVDVVVAHGGGSVIKLAAYTFAGQAPTIMSLSAAVGTANGGQTLTIRGTNFVQGAQVTFGGSAATGETVVNSTTMTAVIPAHAPGAAAVSVSNPDQQSATLNGAFTYLAPGDANGDGRVNAIDISMVVSHDGQIYSAADFNGDGTVGSADMAIVIGRWTW